MLSDTTLRIILFVVLSMMLFSFFDKMYPPFKIIGIGNIKIEKPIEDGNHGIYVPPAQFSHPKCCPDAGRLEYPNTWDNLAPDNNIPGLLPGARMGESLGLDNNPNLSLSSPIRAPLLEMKEDKPSRKVVNCLNKVINESQVPTLTSEQYYKKRFEQCNPYGGNYCQCTNNYIPLPTTGYCQAYNRGMEVCPYPYKVTSADIYNKTMKCLQK
jgi:hypothetical protein